jgi:hypothetical protein
MTENDLVFLFDRLTMEKGVFSTVIGKKEFGIEFHLYGESEILYRK